MTHSGKAIDKIRATEAQELKTKGHQPVLTGSRWYLLKRPEHLTDKQTVKLKELLAINLKTIRAYILKEDFQHFGRYNSAGWVGTFLDDWCRHTMRSRLVPMKKVAKMLRTHRLLLLNWFRAKEKVALGVVEGFNNKAKVTSRKAYGFRNVEVLKIALHPFPPGQIFIENFLLQLRTLDLSIRYQPYPCIRIPFRPQPSEPFPQFSFFVPDRQWRQILSRYRNGGCHGRSSTMISTVINLMWRFSS